MALPAEFIVRLNAQTRVIHDGAALLGGSPTRYVRLSRQAQDALKEREVSASTKVGAQLADKLLELGMADPVVDRLPELKPEYTIVIPVMNRADQLARLLSSVRVATGPATPIIIVDDASVDAASITRVAHEFGADALRLPSNLGPAGARNAGLTQVSTEFVVFLDSDLVINEATIPALLKHFADPLLAVIAPRVMSLAQDSSWIGRYEDVHSALDLGPRASAIRPRSTMSWIPAAAIVARTSALSEGFDEAMRLGEDVDLVWRLSKAGWRIRYEPAAFVQHEHRSDLRGWLTRKYEYGTSAVPLARRHPESIAPAILAPWGIAVMAAGLIQRKWSFALAAGIAGWAVAKSASQLSTAKYPTALGVRLTAKGVTSAYTQTSALMLRHWWPLTVVGCLFSRRVRRATLAVAVADVVIDVVRRRPRIDPVRFGIAKRLDDLAYGAGLWMASLRAGTVAALMPQIARGTNAKTKSNSA